jgi:hypothetical protein
MLKTVGLGMAGAGVALPDDLDRKYRQAWDVLHEAEVGDYVIFNENERSSALEVIETDDSSGERTLVMRGAAGAEALIEEDTRENGTPSLATAESYEPANDLRWATGEEIHDYLEQQEDHPDLDTLETVQPDELRGGADEENEAAELAEDDATPGAEAEQPDSDPPESVGDLRRQGPPEGEDIDDMPALPAVSEEGALERRPPDPVDGDEYVAELSSLPSMDWAEFQEESEVPEAADNEGVVERLVDQTDPTWTFIDELLELGEDVPKTVNNWHLIDYGVVTDDELDRSRQAAWYNIETESLVLLGAMKADDDDVRYFVYHVEDAGPDDPGGSVDPVMSTGRLGDALGKARSILYRDFADTEAEITIHEDPATQEVTVWDAISNTEVLRALAATRQADPFGLRAYASETTVPSFIDDVDSALISLYERIRSASESGAGAWRDFAAGARLPTRERARAFVAGVDVEQRGKDIRALVVSAAVGVRKNFSGVKVQPVLRYNELGIDIHYLYSGRKGDVESGPRRYSLDQPAYLMDSMLPTGVNYLMLMDLAEWLKVDKWQFKIPDNFQNGKVEFKVADGRHTSGSAGPGDPREDAGEAAGIAGRAPNLERWREWDGQRLRTLLEDHADNEPKQLYLVYLAHMEPALEEFDDEEDIEQSFNNRMGDVRVEYRDVYRDFGFKNEDLHFEVFYDALRDYYVGDASGIVDALDQAIKDSPAGAGTLATSGQFDDLEFATGSDPAAEPVTPEVPPEVGEPVEKPDADMTEDDEQYAQALARDLESGDLDIDELTGEDRQVLTRVHNETGLLPDEMADELQRIRGGHDEGEEKTVDQDVGDMMQHLDEMETAGMDSDERRDSVENYHNMTNPGEQSSDPAADDTL